MTKTLEQGESQRENIKKKLMDRREKKTGIMNRNKSCNTNTCSLALTSFFSHVFHIGTVAAIHMILMTDRNHTGRSLITTLNLSCDSQIVPFFSFFIAYNIDTEY